MQSIETRNPPMRDPAAPRPEADDSFMWSDARLLGFAPMDEVHEEFFDVTQRLVLCSEDNAASALKAFVEHAQSHFDQEDAWMVSTDFPARECHIEEHATVLNTAKEIKEALDQGKGSAALVRDFGASLFEWFPGHADYLDSALAAWMTKRKLGGKPVVFRRQAV